MLEWVSIGVIGVTSLITAAKLFGRDSQRLTEVEAKVADLNELRAELIQAAESVKGVTEALVRYDRDNKKAHDELHGDVRKLYERGDALVEQVHKLGLNLERALGRLERLQP